MCPALDLIFRRLDKKKERNLVRAPPPHYTSTTPRADEEEDHLHQWLSQRS